MLSDHFSHFRQLFGRKEVPVELDRASRFDTDRQIGEQVQFGRARQRPVRRAAPECGRAVHYLESLVEDSRHGLRILRRAPGFTAVSVLTLALGIGANTAIFSVISAVLLRPLPYPDPQRIVTLKGSAGPILARLNDSSSPSDPAGWQRHVQSFAAAAAYQSGDVDLTTDGPPERVHGVQVSPLFFRVLGVPPMIGQDWAGQPAGHASALLNWSLWQRRYGGNPHLVGKPAIINDKQVTIAGVMPRGFQFPQDAEIWVPQGTGDDTMLRGVRYYQLIGRIRRDVSLVQSQSEMDAICARFRNESRAGVSNVGIRLVPLQQSLAEGSRGALLVLLAAVGFVLLIACANVANLAFARATGRLKEMAVRAAMGAARWRLMRQLVTESLLLAVLGGALGAGLASWTLHLLTATLPLNLPRITPITVDLRVLLFTALLSLGAGLLFGAAPAIGATKIDLQSHLKEGGTMLGHRRDRFRSVLLVSEVALSFVLLTGAGLMIRTLVCLLAVDPGFQIQHILTCEVVLPSSKFRAGSGRAQPEAPRNPVATTTSHEPSGGPAEEEKAKDGNSAGKNLGGQMTSYFERGVDQLTELPGVESVGAINYLPLGGSAYFALPITTDSQRPGNNPSDDVAAFRAVTPAYFSTLRIPLLAGRFFNLEDGPKSTSVVIINQSMARHFWPNQNPVGRQLRSLKDYEVVGVVGDVRHNSLHDPGGMEMYFPARQFPVPWMTFVIRTSGNPKERASAVRAALLMVDRDQPISQIRAMSDVLDASISPERSRMTLMSVFGGLALLMAAVGCYGVIAVSVGQRTHEVGIRVALGARPMDVLRLIVGHGCRLALIGVAIGLAAAFGLTRLIASMLYGVGATDPVTLSLAAAFLTLVAVIASCVPARRAMRVNPIVALRCE